MWEVEFTDEFEEFWDLLNENEQVDVAAVVNLLERFGNRLGYPHSSKINNAKTTHLRELRIQHAGDPYRVLYAFDPKRCAILLIGGKKTGQDRWYEKYIPIADKLYAEHLITLELEKEEIYNE